jgi:L-ascorbate metabolism protein UlaG (beta-lactamase superfamily)
MKRFVSFFGMMAVFMMLLSSVAYAQDDVTITSWGQSAFKLESGGKTVLIDPWITENPLCPVEVKDITKADLILLTHDHFDHVGTVGDPTTGHAADTIAIAKQTGAIVVAVYDTAFRLLMDGLPPENILNGGFGRLIGGAIDINGISVVMTPAVHSSDSGVAAGYIIKFPGSGNIYHAGDTAIFGDMKLYSKLYPIDIALLPIGGDFTMDAYQAAESLKLLRPGKVIPMHYGTFPMLAPYPDEFVELANQVAPEVNVIVLEPGENYHSN